MAEFAFNCPLCSQKIRCANDWAGQQIQCPACQGNITVPAAQDAKPIKIGVTLAQHEKAPPPVIPAAAQGAHSARAYSFGQGSIVPQGSKAKKITIIALCAVLLPPGLFFGGKAVLNWQTNFNVKRQKEAAEADGGEVGHIAALYDVLDKTDPDKHPTIPSAGESGGSRRSKSQPRRQLAETSSSNMDTNSVADTNAPVQPVWTLDMEQIKLQKGKVNGTISGSNFLASTAFLDVNGPLNVLSIRQGTNFIADSELVFYLRLKTGEGIGSQKWTITSDQTANVPQVVKKWRPNPRFGAQSKSFRSGYAMKLEFGNTNQNTVQGKIFLALPDPEQSVVAGQFTATIRVAKPVPIAQTAPPTQRRMQQRPAFYAPPPVY